MRGLALALIAVFLVATLVLVLRTSTATADSQELTEDTSYTDVEYRAGMQLSIIEDFDGEELHNRWTTCYWWTLDDGCTIAGNDELEWYQPDNVTIGDGIVSLVARPEDLVGTDGSDYTFSSGMLTTGPARNDEPAGMSFRYGYLEARIRVPYTAGTWPAFWLLPADEESRPEIDIMEIVDPSVNKVHLHTRSNGERVSFRGEARDLDLADTWHTFGVGWDESSITWFLDGKSTHRMTSSSLVPDELLYPVINLAIGGVYPGDPDESSVFPASKDVDWLRLWQDEHGSLESAE